MKLLILEPFFSGSHKTWTSGLVKHSQHDVTLYTLPGRHWKWRMHNAAVTFAQRMIQENPQPDLILTTSMVDLSTFLGLLPPKLRTFKNILYFHENQITYPWSPDDPDRKLQRDSHYGYIDYTSALAADKIVYNSRYHMDSFLEELPRFLKQFPDYQHLETVKTIRKKSDVLYLGLDLKKYDPVKTVPKKKKSILWNHRWEYDKAPEPFFEILFRLQEEGLDFECIITGESFKKVPPIFKKAKEKLADHIYHFGYVDSFEKYADLLYRADILPVTSIHDFFGISVVEAMYCRTLPLLPNRLAYPEHIPEAYRKRCLYENQDDLYQKLKQELTEPENVDLGILADYVSRYDWHNQKENILIQ